MMRLVYGRITMRGFDRLPVAVVDLFRGYNQGTLLVSTSPA